MRRPLILLLLLAACSTPQQSCLSTATKDLRVVDKLIAETEVNLARGYAISREPAVRTGLELCVSPDDPFLFCTTRDVTVAEKPVAIDAGAERAKLASLKAKRAELVARANAEIAQCRAQFPEG